MSWDNDLLTAFFAILILIDLVGNTLVCLVVLRSRLLRTPMNLLLVNLAVADMMVAVFMAPRHVLLGTFAHPVGRTGDFVCKFLTGSNFIWVGGAVSSFCLVSLAFERYYLIVYPHREKGRITKNKLKVIIIACWIYALLVDIPPFLVIYYNEERQFCTESWPVEFLPKAYTVLMFGLDFAVLVLIMGLLYIKVVRSLWSRRARGDGAQMAVLHRRRKAVTKTVLTVRVIYAFFWLPVMTLYLLSHHHPTQFEYASVEHNTAVLLLCVNSSINPVIYTFQMNRFQQELQRLLSRKLTAEQSHDRHCYGAPRNCASREVGSKRHDGRLPVTCKLVGGTSLVKWVSGSLRFPLPLPPGPDTRVIH